MRARVSHTYTHTCIHTYIHTNIFTGVPDMVVSAPGKDLVYIVYLKREEGVGVGVLNSQTIAPPAASTTENMMFGASLAVLGDIDSNGAGELKPAYTCEACVHV